MFNYKHSEETKEKISNSLKEYYKTVPKDKEEQRANKIRNTIKAEYAKMNAGFEAYLNSINSVDFL